MRKQLADPDPAFAMLRETEGRSEERAQLIFVAADRFSGELFAVFRIQPRLGVKQIDVTRAPPHEQKDDASRAGRKMGSGQCEGPTSGLAFGPGAFTR